MDVGETSTVVGLLADAAVGLVGANLTGDAAAATTTLAPPPNTTTGSDPAPIYPPMNKCNYYVKKNQTVVFEFANQYGGIPQNLVFNLIGWSLLVLLFTILRRSAGNYGRLALVRKDDDESKWTQLFFAPDDTTGEIPEDDEEAEASPGAGGDHLPSLASIDYNEVDTGLCSWMLSIFTLSDDKFLAKCGMDAVQYLKFQRHLIFFVLVMTIICICVILPINFQGDIQGTEVDFGHTTISNLRGTDQRLWVHIVVVILFFPLGIFIMRKFSVNLRMEEEECISSRTLMIVGVPESCCTKEFLTRHFYEAYPEFEIDDVQIAYDVARLTELDNQRERARRARIYCENYISKRGAGQQMKPFACGILCPCCGKSVDALSFYQREEETLVRAVEDEKARIKTRSIGIAFVTFSSLTDAKQVAKDHRNRCSGCLSNPPHSSISSLMEPQNWTVRFAPPPDDIYWENLTADTYRLFLIKAVFINFVLFVVLFFFTSPAYIISQLELILNFKTFTPSEKINDFIPTLMLWTLSALLPIVVAFSDWWMGHWRRSVENQWIFRKVFFYLLFMVLILPSIGLTSLRAAFEIVFQDKKKTEMMWNCIFLPDNGAFFVNYVITSALVGTALELMRFSELFMYAARMAFARSAAEVSHVRRANLYEFPFGFNYGWMLLVFALTSAYAVVCPLITPFGLFYMIMKHCVDRYNLYFAYKRSKINKNIHATAVNCVIVSLLIQQLVLLFFNILRSQDDAANSGKLLSPRAIFSLVMLTIFTVLFLAQMFFHIFKGISPLQYVQQRPRLPSEDAYQQQEREEGGGGDVVRLGATNGLSTRGVSGSTSGRRRRANKQFVPDVLKSDHTGGLGGFALGPVSVDAAPPDDDGDSRQSDEASSNHGEGDAAVQMTPPSASPARTFADYGSTTPRP